MKSKKRVLVTGNNGYIGSVMVPWLLQCGYDVRGLDTNYFVDCTLVSPSGPVSTIVKDLRDVIPSDLHGLDSIIHLAALSNDPIGNLNDEWTKQINFEGTVRLAEMAKEAGVRRFILSSSCIMYGMSEAAVMDEDSPLAPQTEYARSKVRAEKALSELADDNFSPTYCRNGTVYGLSSRMRFDTVLNNFMGRAFCTGRVEVHSDGTPWRPVVHVQDVARAFQAVLEAPIELIHNQAFNTGADELNHTIRQLAEIVAETVPGCKLVMVPQPGADQRTYKAGFSKFKATFPDFKFLWNPRSGAIELYKGFQSFGLTHEAFTDKRFTRLRWLQHLLDNNMLDPNLRWQKHVFRVA